MYLPADDEKTLQRWEVADHWDVSGAELLELQRAIDEAEDERPIQKHLEANPKLLAITLSGGHGRWVRPQVRLGSQYVADFILAEGDSGGLWYTLVEIEGPTKPMFTKTGELAVMTRHAIDQVQEWRNWIAENGGYARKPAERDGVGLPEISSTAAGLVLIGRQAGLPAPELQWRRRRVWEESRIQIHTYDWLLDVITSRIVSAGYPNESV